MKSPNNAPDWLSAVLAYDRMSLEVRPDVGGTGLVVELTHKRAHVMEARVLTRVINEEAIEQAKAAVCQDMVATLLKLRYLAHGETRFARLFRCEVVNQLIQIISQHGLCYFYNERHNRVARMVYEDTVYLHDEKSGNKVELRKNGSWEGFGHGGTLRDLVLMMREYVMCGRRIDPVFIGLERTNGQGNIWGYPADEMAKCRAEAAKLAILAPARGRRAA